MVALLDLGILIRGSRAEQRVPCPHCKRSDRDDTLGVNIETGVFHCFRCGWAGCAGRAEAPAKPIERIDDPAVAARKRERLRRIWKRSVPLSDPAAGPVRQYLATRGLGEILKDPPPCLRAHPGITYWEGTTEVGIFPAMLALFTGTNEQPVTLHATFLRHDGYTKAPVPSPKKILGVPVRGATRGGSIRLYQPERGVLGIAEGIESALSLHLIQRVPVWSAFCADNLAAVLLPAGLTELHIGVDVDPSGQGERVANELAQRALRSNPTARVLLVRPDIDGAGDLNDELRRRAS